jgi:O-6-methylguanine DNA methyltransferase
VLERLGQELKEYFGGERRAFSSELLYPGTSFQERVWSALREIPYGETWSYKDLAVRVGDVLATRAVGAANGENPIAIVIPCHRVINSSGDLGGYGGGLWRKRILLDLERGQGRLEF